MLGAVMAAPTSSSQSCATSTVGVEVPMSCMECSVGPVVLTGTPLSCFRVFVVVSVGLLG